MSAPRRYVALLRGINVGGRNKVAMAALRETCEAVGCTDVATYIQSGNVVLASPLRAAGLRAALEEAIADRLGVAPVVVVRTRVELAEVIARNPFPDADTANLHVAFLAGKLDSEAAAGLGELESPPEELAARDTEVYLHLPNGLGRAKLPVALGRRLSVPSTVRNWRTVTTLREMLDA
ncbi:MAG: DUF1697 domain-containing protein [Gaiellaceae bacterium]